MPDLTLNDAEQQALRDLLAAEPCPGAPLPSGRVLERLVLLLHADALRAVYQGGESVSAGASPGPPAVDAGAGLSIEFCHGDSRVRLTFLREGPPFSDRDLTVLRLIDPLVARLVRERPHASPPAGLTSQERHVLNRVAAGDSNVEIAEHLFIAPSTVRKHLENAYRKLGVHNRMAAVVALEGGARVKADIAEQGEIYA